MTSRFVFHPAARGDLLEARDWYELQRPGLGGKFACAIEVALEILAVFHHRRDPAVWRGRAAV